MLEWLGIITKNIKIVLLLIIFIFGTEIEIHQIIRSIFAFLGLSVIQSFHLYA